MSTTTPDLCDMEHPLSASLFRVLLEQAGIERSPGPFGYVWFVASISVVIQHHHAHWSPMHICHTPPPKPLGFTTLLYSLNDNEQPSIKILRFNCIGGLTKKLILYRQPHLQQLGKHLEVQSVEIPISNWEKQ